VSDESTSDRNSRKWLNRNVVAMGFTSLFSDASHEMVTAVLPFFLAILGAGPAILGLIEGFSDVSSSLVKSFSGYLSDKIGRRKPLLNIGYALTGIFTPLIALTTSWPQVLVLRISAWTGRGARDHQEMLYWQIPFLQKPLEKRSVSTGQWTH